MSESQAADGDELLHDRLKPSIVPIVLHQSACTPNELYASGDDSAI